MRFIQKIIDFLFVNLKVAAVYSVAFAAKVRFLLDHVKYKINGAWHDTFILPRFHVGSWDSLIICLVLVAFHRESFS